MNIELWIEGFEQETEETLSFIASARTLLAESVSEIGLSEDALNRVLIADSKHFGRAVDELSRGEGYTDNKHFVAVAKTFLQTNDVGTLTNSLVLREFILAIVLEAKKNNDLISNWSDNEQLLRYVIFHELGHCTDNSIRVQSPEINLKDERGWFKIHQVARYYCNIIAVEFAACVWSATAMTESVYSQDLNSTIKSIESMILEIQTNSRAYDGNSNNLYHLAFSVSGVFWTILVQYAKLIGSKIGNPALAHLPMKLWNEGNKATAEILSLFGEELMRIWGEYPHWRETTFLEVLIPIWHSLTQANGYKFVEGPTGDAIFW